MVKDKDARRKPGSSAKKQGQERPKETPPSGTPEHSPAPLEAEPQSGEETGRPAGKTSPEESPPDDAGRRAPVSLEESPPDNAARRAPAFPIVAIGASAGGLDALRQFFSRLPPKPGIAFVVITHVQPERKSLLPELLSAATEMEIVSSENRLRVEPNKVIVARDSLLGMWDGELVHVKHDSKPEVTYHPIDHFFRALADDQREHAIGIILSGSGNDGTLGLKAIKAAGGMVMVQKPESAKYSGMPESAIVTGLADFILPPDELPEALLDFVRGPFLRAARPEGQLLPDEAIYSILVRLRNHSDQDFTCYKKSTISRRVQRRMAVHQIDDPRKYLALLRDEPHELDALLQDLLISVTSFFRDPEAFDALAARAIPQLLSSRGDGETIRVWVPGCATGEEAYSVAIILHEQIRASQHLHGVQIFATDIDERAIDIARAGIYSEAVAADISPARLQQYFNKDEECYRISKSIRDLVVFAHQNVVSDPPFTRVDLIVCRNLLIYLDAGAQHRVLPMFHYALRSGGVLFLGSSESVGDSTQLFDVIDAKHKVFRRRETVTEYPALGRSTQRTRVGGEEIEATPRGRPGHFFLRGIEKTLLEEFVPCVAVVDDHGCVLYIRGRMGRFLEPEQGQPRNDILEMARQGLGGPLSSALRQARESHRETTRTGVRVRTNGETIEINVRVKPLRLTEQLRGLLMVAFEPVPVSDHVSESTTAVASEDRARMEMEKELRYTRENLQTTIEELETSNEELKSSNEELQSTNEELQSTNEELETSKEEMQSLNEELNTVNAELQSKVEALARAHDDMKNLLDSMQVATIFLDRNLRVKRYTEKAKDVIRLIGTDIGRPVSDLTSSLEYDTLVSDCRDVLATLNAKEREVQDEKGRWYLVRLMPYRTAQNVIDGLVVTIVDIDRARRAEDAEAAARVSREFFKSIVETMREPLLVVDAELNVVMTNDAFHRKFRTRPEDVDGKNLFDLQEGRWNIAELRSHLHEILEKDGMLKDFRMDHEFPWVGRKAFLLNARKLDRAGMSPDMILLALQEVGVS